MHKVIDSSFAGDVMSMDGCVVVEPGSVFNVLTSQAVYYLPMAGDVF